MRSLLGRIMASESPESIDKSGHVMANKIRTVQKNRKKMVTEELKAVIAERDTAVEKVINIRYKPYFYHHLSLKWTLLGSVPTVHLKEVSLL